MGLTKHFNVKTEGSGSGTIGIAWNPATTLLAVAGAKGRVQILNRQGEVQHQFTVPSVLKMAWDPHGDTLALIPETAPELTLYSHVTRKTESIDTGLHGLTVLCWCPKSSQLAIGNKNGALMFYNRDTQRKLPIVGTHSQAIVASCWTAGDRLVMAGRDRILSVSDTEGNVMSSTQLGGVPLSLTPLESAETRARPVVVANLGSSLEVVTLGAKESFTAQFQKELGNITAVAGVSDSAVALGFSSGHVGIAVVGPNSLTLTNSVQAFRDEVRAISYSDNSDLVAAVGDSALRILSRSPKGLTEVKEDEQNFECTFGSMVTVQWSPNGQYVTACARDGNVTTFSAKVLNVSTYCGMLIFYFISARVVGVRNIRDGKVMCTIPVESDPAFMAAGMGVLATVMGNQVRYYEYFIPNSFPQEAAIPATPSMPISGGPQSPTQEPHSKLIRAVDYPSKVADVKVCSKYAAVLLNGRVQLHSIADSEEPPISFPPGNEAQRVVAMGISETLFIYATNAAVRVVALQGMQTVAEFTCRTGLRRAFPNPSCTRVAYIDANNDLFLLNPITEVASQAEGHDADHKEVLWDQADSTVFVTHDDKSFITFICSPHSRHGSTCESVLVRDSSTDNLVTPVPVNSRPLTLFRGMAICQAASGVLDTVPLRSHHNTMLRTPDPEAFYNNFSLNRLRWSSQNISTPQEAEDLAVKALHMLDIELAIRVYRQLSQPGLVMCLEKIKHIHEKNLLIGHVSMIMGYFKDAQTFFLRSSQPLCALEMRRDLMQWEPALSLAAELAPAETPIISKEYAQQLEYRGEYVKALEMYKNGNRPTPSGHAGAELTAALNEVAEHNRVCREGTARCHLRTGNVREGMEIALASENMPFVTECAKLCEESTRYDEAAQLYERAGDIDRAATLYIEKCNKLKAAARLLPRITSRNIIGLFAAAKEREGDFKEAEAAYTQSEDWDNVVRLKVEKLNDLHGAHVIVRKTRSADAAALVAKMCKQKGQLDSAVEFLVLAKSYGEAFDLAKEKDCMFNYESTLLSQTQLTDGVAPLLSQPEFVKIAKYYEDQGKSGRSAMFYQIAGNFPMALQKYLEAGEPEDIEKAVEVVGQARSDALTNKLIDYLMGEADGVPKEPSYIFKLYMALGSFEKAAKTSVIIATREQEMGDYRSAHKTLVEACRLLRSKNMRIPNDLRRSLMILHSYVIVKDLIKVLKDEKTAARMLLRVSHNVPKFPAHIPAILTSTVLQCVKADFKKSAFEVARIIIQNEKYRTELNEKNRKRIEGIVRRRGREELEDPPEPNAPCPFCDAPVAETELDCGACKNTLPFCIVTGKHIVKSDYTTSPCCGFPAIYSVFNERLQQDPTCPLCETVLDINTLQKQPEPNLKDMQ